MEDEGRTHLLGSSDNGEQRHKELVHASWDHQQVQVVDEKYPIHDSSSSSTSSSFTWTLVFTAFVSVLGSFTFGFAVGYTSPVQSEIMEELRLSTAEYSFFGSILNIGAAMSAVVCGRLADLFGRRRALQIADIFYIFGWLVIAISQEPWSLDLGRWMTGFAITLVGYTVPVYIAEFTPKKLRGGFVLLHLFMLTVGSSLIFLIGLIIPWRTLALVGIIPSLLQIVGLFFVPESPRWLMMIGRDEEFNAALQCVRGANADISQEATDMKESAEALQQMSKVSFMQLFQRKYAYVLTVGIGIVALSALVGLNGIQFYARTIFESAGFSGEIGTVVLGVGQLPTVVVSVIFMDSFGRRPLLMISAAGLCIGCLLAGFSFLLQDHHLLPGISPYFALVGLLIYIAAYSIGIGGIPGVICSEIFPINIKGLAGSVGAVANCLCAWTVSYAFNFLIEWSSSGTFFVFAGICAFTLVFVDKLVPETKGRTLEEIHKAISHIWQ